MAVGEPTAYDVDIAVIGGGPGGLAVAAAVQSAFKGQVKVKVYESLRRYKLQGSGVLMHPNVQHALEAIDPNLLERCREKGVASRGIDLVDEDGTLIASYPPGAQHETKALEKKYGKAAFVLGWHEIRHLLHQYLPQGTVQFGKQMSHYEEDSKGVTVHFADGQPSVRAKLLVGADGYFSKVRSQCLDDGPPDFVGSIMWRARIAWREGMPHPDIGASILYGKPWPLDNNKRFGMLFKMGTTEETKDRPWSWVLSAPIEFVTAAGIDFNPEVRSIKSVQGETEGKTSALENATKVFADFPASLMDIVQDTEPSTVTQHGLYMRPLGNNPFFSRCDTSTAKNNGGTGTSANDTAGKGGESDPRPEALDPTARVAELKARKKATQAAESTQKAGQVNGDQKRNHSRQQEQNPEQESQEGNRLPDKVAELKISQKAKQASDQSQSKQTAALSSEQSNPDSKGAKSTTAGGSMTSTGDPLGKQANVDGPSQAFDADQTTDRVGQASNFGQSSDAADEKSDVAWGRGRVTLLGDAAHATIPNGQGLCLTVEDAAVLGWHLKQQGICEAALRSYEEERPLRVKVMHAKANDNAPAADRERYIYKPTFKSLWRDSQSPSSQASTANKQKLQNAIPSLQSKGESGTASPCAAKQDLFTQQILFHYGFLQSSTDDSVLRSSPTDQ